MGVAVTRQRLRGSGKGGQTNGLLKSYAEKARLMIE